jgi:uncharacterized NAD(P)/FAD-binding protein YdhS
MVSSVAFVGAGPTTLYTLAALVDRIPPAASITVFEEQSTAGLGAPYRPGWNDPAMLSNIASIEIPPLDQTLVDWLAGRPPAELRTLGLEPSAIDDRAFVPRVVLGRYFRAQFDRLVGRLRRRGVAVSVRIRCRVADVANTEAGVLVTVVPRPGISERLLFDHVVLATGHQWPAEQEVRPGYFLSPWPAMALASIPAVEVGLRGSSLTAIDAAVALAGIHGRFVREDADELSYLPNAETEGFRITMMSRKGLLPEADFFFPLPHAPLSICTPSAIEALIARGDEDLLDQAFDLFRREMLLIDPDYAAASGLEKATLETFCESYFAERAAADPFEWAQTNLAEARRNHRDRITVPWRYAILRMHEVLAPVVPHLEPEAFGRFNRHFKPVFVDDYGAVPHESIERMLALHRAGSLEVLALGDDYRLDTDRPEGGVVLHRGEDRRHFPVFIEATGQRPLSAIQFPFLSLLEQGIVRDEAAEDGASRGIAVDDLFRPTGGTIPQGRLFCLGLPFLMGRHPFVQGITSSHEMGETVGAALASMLASPDLSLIATEVEAA